MREPRDIIGDHKYGRISDDQMLKELTEYDYTFGWLPIPWDTAYVPGTWDQVEHAYYVGQLTDGQLKAIMDNNKTIQSEDEKNES